MATYGIRTVKSDNSTVVFQNSAKSGVFARTFTCIPANGYSRYPNDPGYYRKEFPEYNGRSMRVFELKAGTALWYADKLTTGLNVIDFQVGNGTAYSYIDPKFTVGPTVLYIFVK
jgi:hypothetical protein